MNIVGVDRSITTVEGRVHAIATTIVDPVTATHSEVIVLRTEVRSVTGGHATFE